jgi:hypothetical protein
MFKLASIQTEYLEQRGNVIFRIWMGDTFVRAQERERGWLPGSDHCPGFGSMLHVWTYEPCRWVRRCRVRSSTGTSAVCSGPSCAAFSNPIRLFPVFPETSMDQHPSMALCCCPSGAFVKPTPRWSKSLWRAVGYPFRSNNCSFSYNITSHVCCNHRGRSHEMATCKASQEYASATSAEETLVRKTTLPTT